MPAVFVDFEGNEAISGLVGSFSESGALVAGDEEFSFSLGFVSIDEMDIGFFV
jgi:hypothetical protein